MLAELVTLADNNAYSIISVVAFLVVALIWRGTR